MQNTLSQFPSFHDGYLTGIELAETSAVVALQHYDGTRYRLHLSGIEALLANEFRQGNIISSLKVTTGTSPDIGDLRLLWPALHPEVTDEYRHTNEIFVEDQRSKIERGEAVWLKLTASYGCDLVAVCKSVELVALDINANSQISN
ncbi:hypothetical protein [Mesorhizobium sp.]|uniref:hypothetical protein n=1 Tax=Mesorhizobium sp. TaxID=1871066 RepID=UPI000FE4A1CF|nr:hypothetical protein [Mesorhizobium sp.]RWA83933.1 MAG: hypothetical protein EOQ30_11400 [Mesorhizobium sp.]